MKIIRTLQDDCSHEFGVSELDDYLLGLKLDYMKQIRQKLQQINPSKSKISFEKICERVLMDHGYQVNTRIAMINLVGMLT